MNSTKTLVPPVVCIGDVFVDRVAHLETMPKVGQGAWATPLQDFGGGTGGNVAAGLGSFEIPVSLVAGIGNDQIGKIAAKQLQDSGVDISKLIVSSEVPSGEVIIFVDATGERTILPCAIDCAYTKITKKDLEYLVKQPPPFIFFTGCPIANDPIGTAMVDLALSLPTSVRVYFDPNLRQPPSSVTTELKKRFQAIANRADVVLAGEEEVEILELTQQIGQDFIVKRGSNGAILSAADSRKYLISAHEVKVVDAIGAGDCFVAGYIAAEVRGYNSVEALKIANAAGAYAVSRHGARVQPSWDEVLYLAQKELVRNL